MTARGGLVAALACALSCGNVPLGDGERRLTVQDLTDDVIVPTLMLVELRTTTLREDVIALAADLTGERLETARQAWREAREPWTEAEAFSFGPANDLRLAPAIDQWPVEAARIEEEIAGAAALDATYVSGLGANRKGFHALEHLLFEGDALAALAGSARRRAYLVAVAEVLARDAAALADAWRDDYAARFKDPGGEHAAFPTVQAAIDRLVNDCVTAAETVAELRLGKPAGHDSGGEPQPALVESGPSDHAAADLLGNLRGVRAIYAGGGARSLGSIVAARSPRTDRDVRAALDEAERRVAAVPRPFRAALASDPEAVEAAYDAVKELEVLLRTEVIGILGATVRFNGNDGD